jgi:hypothetical protein
MCAEQSLAGTGSFAGLRGARRRELEIKRWKSSRTYHDFKIVVR